MYLKQKTVYSGNSFRFVNKLLKKKISINFEQTLRKKILQFTVLITRTDAGTIIKRSILNHNHQNGFVTFKFFKNTKTVLINYY